MIFISIYSLNFIIKIKDNNSRYFSYNDILLFFFLFYDIKQDFTCLNMKIIIKIKRLIIFLNLLWFFVSIITN